MFQNQDEDPRYWHKQSVNWALPVIFHNQGNSSALKIDSEHFPQVIYPTVN